MSKHLHCLHINWNHHCIYTEGGREGESLWDLESNKEVEEAQVKGNDVIKANLKI